jgi:hypothetical protein
MQGFHFPPRKCFHAEFKAELRDMRRSRQRREITPEVIKALIELEERTRARQAGE